MRQLVKVFLFLPMLAWGFAFSTTAPFNECPAIGSDTSCAILYVYNANGTISAFGDATQGPYDGSDDTLVGVLNNSNTVQTSLTLTGVGLTGIPIFGFEQDGICTYAPFTGSSYCSGAYYQTDPGDYAGPQNTFTNISSDQKTGTIVFTGGLAPGAATYFSLEDRLNAASPPTVTGGGGTTSVPAASTYSLIACAILLAMGAGKFLRRAEA